MKKNTTNKQKIFCVFNIGKIGDVLVSTPLCREIKTYYPGSKLIYIGSPYAKDVIKNIPDVDEYFFFDKDGEHKGLTGIFKFVYTFKYFAKIDYCFIVHRYNKPVIVSRLIFAKRIISDYHHTKCYKFLLTDKLYKNEKERPEYVLEQYAKYINFNKGDNFPIIKDMFININNDAKTSTEKMLQDNNIADKKIVTLFFNLFWPGEKIAELAIKLSDMGFTPVLVGLKNTKDIADTAEKCSDGKLYNFAGKTSLEETFALVDRSSLVVSVDTGAMHIAVALKKPLVALSYKNLEQMWLHKDKCKYFISYNDIPYSDISVDAIIEKVKEYNIN